MAVNSPVKMQNTTEQYNQVVTKCRELFLKKTADYGTSWRVLRQISIVDQLYIKAWRIRQIQEKQVQWVSDSIESEFVAIVNYGIMALIQLDATDELSLSLTEAEAAQLYDDTIQAIVDLMLRKNQDYGEAWRDMSQESFVDLILVKLLRIKQILANDGYTTVSEGMDANFRDIVNYAIFALVRIEESRSSD